MVQSGWRPVGQLSCRLPDGHTWDTRWLEGGSWPRSSCKSSLLLTWLTQSKTTPMLPYEGVQEMKGRANVWRRANRRACSEIAAVSNDNAKMLLVGIQSDSLCFHRPSPRNPLAEQRPQSPADRLRVGLYGLYQGLKPLSHSAFNLCGERISGQ